MLDFHAVIRPNIRSPQCERITLVLITTIVQVLCVCLPSIHCEGFICLEQLQFQGADQRCCIKEVFYFSLPSPFMNAKSLRMKHQSFLTSHFILCTHQKQVKLRLNQCSARFHILRPLFSINRHRHLFALHDKLICLWCQTLMRGVTI